MGVRSAQDVGEIAVLQDAGDLMIKPNPADLSDVGLRLAPNAAGGYDVSTISYGFKQPLGSSITLADDATNEIVLPFAFSFFGVSRDRVFVNSDGNLTFDEGDAASTDRSVSRLLTGPPRIAPFFADLNPSSGGRVLTSGDGGAFSVTWCAVPEYGGRAIATVQVTLLADGAIEMQVSNRTTLRTAVVGVSPGHTTEFMPVDLTAGGTIDGGHAAVGEHFTTTSELDTVGVARRFLAVHADEFDNLVIFTDTQLLNDAFAYEISIANGIQGLNLPTFDYSSEYGSTGRLQSLCNMDALSKYPDDPYQKFLGENSTLGVMGGWPSSSSGITTGGDRRPCSGATRRTGASFSIQMRQCSRATRSTISVAAPFAPRQPCSGTACSISTRWASSTRPRCLHSSTCRARRTSHPSAPPHPIRRSVSHSTESAGTSRSTT